MKLLLLLSSFISVTFCENPHNDLTVVIEMATLDADVNGDGIISEQEFLDEFIAKWDSDVPSDYVLSQHDFVEGWTKKYGDNHKDTTTFFHRLDSDGNGVLTANDLNLHWPLLDTDGNLEVSTEEFGAFIRLMHPCGQHGHLGC